MEIIEFISLYGMFNYIAYYAVNADYKKFLSTFKKSEKIINNKSQQQSNLINL